MIKDDVVIGEGARIFQPDLVNLYGCEIGAETKVGAFVEIRKGVKIGARCKIQAFAFIPEGVTVEDEVFIGPHACFTNDLFPRAVGPGGSVQNAEDWTMLETRVGCGSSVGANATILCGITIGPYALIGAGSVVLSDVPPYAVVVGNPARVIGDVRTYGRAHRPTKADLMPFRGDGSHLPR
jgi:UDP-2-acetamido-3-amino-2,3-dideoxy-glucuronate N-acetyltransferase